MFIGTHEERLKAWQELNEQYTVEKIEHDAHPSEAPFERFTTWMIHEAVNLKVKLNRNRT